MTIVPFLTTPEGISRRAGICRAAVLRVVTNQLVAPDAWLERGESGGRVPLFAPERIAEILAHVSDDGRRRESPQRPVPAAGLAAADAPARTLPV